MSKKFDIVPYKSIGSCAFGMNRNDVIRMLGTPLSTTGYGYPNQDGFLDDYGYFYVMCNNKGEFEAVEIFPIYIDDTIELNYSNMKIELSSNIERTLEEFKKITDDMIEDEEGYSSKKLGVGLFCPEDEVENAIFYAPDYY